MRQPAVASTHEQLMSSILCPASTWGYFGQEEGRLFAELHEVYRMQGQEKEVSDMGVH